MEACNFWEIRSGWVLLHWVGFSLLFVIDTLYTFYILRMKHLSVYVYPARSNLPNRLPIVLP